MDKMKLKAALLVLLAVPCMFALAQDTVVVKRYFLHLHK